MLDDAMRGGIVNARQRLQVIGRCAIDVDGALLLHTFNHALKDGLRIASSSRGCTGCLLANLIGAAVMLGATGKNNRN